MTFRFKVCGITDAVGLDAAVASGADAVGFNFHPGSPRFIDAPRARALVARLPDAIASVGVFVNRPLDEVVAWMDESGVGWAQFHGDEQAATLVDFPRPWYPALRPAGEMPIGLERWTSPFVLVDACRPGLYGGTGRTADWAVARRIARVRDMVLAGGLGPDNLAAALAAVGPAGVDLNSGVESAPGVKDAARLARAGAVLAGWQGRGEEH